MFSILRWVAIGLVTESLVFVTPGYSAKVALVQAIAQAQRLSPDIRNLQNQLESTEAKARQALAPSEPNFNITYGDMTQAFNPSLSASTAYQLTQPLAFPGKAFVNRASISEQAEALRSQLRSMELQVATNIKTAYYQLGLAKKNIQINKTQQDFYERLLAIAKRRYEAGSITQVDFLNTKLSLYSNENDLADLQANVISARTQLNVLLYNPIDFDIEVDPIPVTEHPPIDVSLARAKMIDQRPEIRAAAHQVSSADKLNKLAWMSLLPDFQLTAGTTFYNVSTATPYSGLPDAPLHTYSAQVQLTMPLWFLLNEREGIVSTGHDRAAADANLGSVVNQSNISFETSLANLNAMRVKLDNYEKNIVPLSKQSLDLALVSYGTGKIDFVTLATTAMAWRNAQRDYFAMLVNYLTSYASFGQLLGEDL